MIDQAFSFLLSRPKWTFEFLKENLSLLLQILARPMCISQLCTERSTESALAFYAFYLMGGYTVRIPGFAANQIQWYHPAVFVVYFLESILTTLPLVFLFVLIGKISIPRLTLSLSTRFIAFTIPLQIYLSLLVVACRTIIFKDYSIDEAPTMTFYYMLWMVYIIVPFFSRIVHTDLFLDINQDGATVALACMATLIALTGVWLLVSNLNLIYPEVSFIRINLCLFLVLVAQVVPQVVIIELRSEFDHKMWQSGFLPREHHPSYFFSESYLILKREID